MSLLPCMLSCSSVAENSTLDLALRRSAEAAAAVWTAFSVPEADFRRFLEARLPSDGDKIAALERMHVTDLYLVCACLEGNERAMAALEDYLTKVAAQLARRRPGVFDDDARQLLRSRLLVVEGTGEARLGGYLGAGPLMAWLLTVATRVALTAKRGEKTPGGDDLVRELGAEALDPEMRYLKSRYGSEVENALRAAIAGLTAHEASLLRLHFLEGVTSDAIARMYQVTRRTVHRWLAEARDRITEQVRRTLSDRLGVSAAELDSLIAFVQSQVDLTIQAYLGDDPKKG